VEEAFEEGQCSRANDVQDEESFARLHWYEIVSCFRVIITPRAATWTALGYIIVSDETMIMKDEIGKYVEDSGPGIL
jgi:hypothetical protein